jgi:SNF2 family DNA or RNA helicase
MDNGREKIVIFCWEIQEMKDAAFAAKKAGYNIILFHGKTPEHERERKLIKFDESKKPQAFIAQIKTGSLGVSLTAASEAIIYSHRDDFEAHTQAPDRLHRIGQHHPVTYYNLITRHSINETTWMSLKTKKRVADYCLRKPELLRGIEL